MEKKAFSPTITVFVAFNSSHLIQPFFFERYCRMIKEHLIPEMKRKRSCSHAIFQQDGAPPHTAAMTRELLNSSFGTEKVISKGFPFEWPPYSPDLSPCDFWL